MDEDDGFFFDLSDSNVSVEVLEAGEEGKASDVGSSSSSSSSSSLSSSSSSSSSSSYSSYSSCSKEESVELVVKKVVKARKLKEAGNSHIAKAKKKTWESEGSELSEECIVEWNNAMLAFRKALMILPPAEGELMSKKIDRISLKALLSEGIDVEHERKALLSNLSLCLLKKGCFEEAIKAVNKALECQVSDESGMEKRSLLDKMEAKLRYRRAYAQTQSPTTSESKTSICMDLLKVLELEPGNSSAQSLLNQVKSSSSSSSPSSSPSPAGSIN